jgi:hypothetical protein
MREAIKVPAIKCENYELILEMNKVRYGKVQEDMRKRRFVSQKSFNLDSWVH